MAYLIHIKTFSKLLLFKRKKNAQDNLTPHISILSSRKSAKVKKKFSDTLFYQLHLIIHGLNTIGADVIGNVTIPLSSENLNNSPTQHFNSLNNVLIEIMISYVVRISRYRMKLLSFFTSSLLHVVKAYFFISFFLMIIIIIKF